MLYVQRADLGVLLDHVQLESALEKQFRIEHLPFYAEAARKAGVSVIFFSDRLLLESHEQIQAYSWNHQTETYQAGLYQIPSVIHNRLILTKERVQKLQPLMDLEQTTLFNGVTRFDKWEVHQLLSTNPKTSKYLPKTAPLKTNKQINIWLQKHAAMYLKPRFGSLGRGVIRLRQLGQEIEQIHTVRGSTQHATFGKKGICDIKKKIGTRPYLIQEAIPLFKIFGQPVDFRVAVQKEATGNWSVTGIVARVGTTGSHTTNLAVGGMAVHANKVLRKGFGKIQAEILSTELERAAIMIARQLENLGPHTADLGLDLAVDRNGSIQFIEANGRDLRITFREAKLSETWEHTFQNPILYGAYLITEGRKNSEANLLWTNVKNESGHRVDRPSDSS